MWASLFAMNVRLAVEGVDYGAAESSSAFQHFWSLAIEEQFYLVWPVLVLAASGVWWSRRRSGGGRPGVSRVGLNLVVGAGGVASFVFGVHQTQVAQSLAYFVTPARAWELAAGGLVAVNAGWLARRSWLGRGWLAWSGLVVIAVSAVVITESSAFPGYWALLPVGGTCMVVVAGLSRATSAERVLLAQPLSQGLGKISYGLYLWHWPLLVLAPYYLGTDQLTVWQACVVALIATWLSTFTFGSLEDPLRRAASLAARPVRALALGVTMVLVSSSTAAATLLAVPDPRGTGSYVEPLQDVTAASLRQAVTSATTLGAVPSNTDPGIAESAEDKPVPSTGDGVSCMVDLLDTTLAREPEGTCVFGAEDGARTVVVTGDSHAYQWMPALEKLAVERGWRLVNLTKSGCPLYDVQLVNSKLKRDYTECYAWRANALSRIKAESPDLVLTSAAIGSTSRDATLTPRWERGVRRTVEQLRATGAQVLVMGDTPYPQQDVPTCLADNVDSAAACVVSVNVARSDPARRKGTLQVAEQAGAATVEPTSWFCEKTKCPALVGNTVVYSDNSHVSATYSALLTPLLEGEIDRALG
ncbi:MAG: acyltransferase [Micrococcales bacterium]|nr:MAG: acyltransferase [Micrococcales bacterium]